MSAWLALLLAAGGGPDEPAGGPGLRVEPYASLRGGVWAADGFVFTTVDGATVRQFDTHVLGTAGVEAGVAIESRFILFATIEGATAPHATAQVAGLHAGFRERAAEGVSPLVPHETTLYAGALWGRFEIDEPGFGTFDDDLGYAAGVALRWGIAEGWSVQLMAEYRALTFDYEGPSTGGDREVGGSSVWAGAAIELRF
jgi:hypothetical protein